MANNIEELKGKISASGGIANAYFYKVFLPESIGTISKYDLNLLCTGTSMPGRTLTTQVRQMGMTRKNVVTGYSVEDITFNFIVTNDSGVRKYFDIWQEIIVGNSNGHEAAYYDEYTRDIEIHQLKRARAILGRAPNVERNTSNAPSSPPEMTTTHHIKLIDAYPISVAPIAYGNAQGLTEAIQLDVTFTFKDWTSIPVKSEVALPLIYDNINPHDNSGVV
jgi:hypothetical protein